MGTESASDADEPAKIPVYVRGSTWNRLNARKEKGVTFDDVIRSLLDDAEALER